MHAEAMARTGSRRRRNCREHKARLNSRIFRLERTFSLRLHAKRPIFSTNPMKGNSIVPNLKNQDRVLATRPDQAPATLRDVHDCASDPRRQSALRRPETILGAPLASLPVEIDWVDAQFPREGFGGSGMPWISERAYRYWRTTVRNAIRRHLASLMIPAAQPGLLRSRHLSITQAHCHSPAPADQIFRTDVNRVVARYADFRKTASGPRSD